MMIEQRRSGESGFSLIETVIAMAILATGLLSLAGVFAMGLRNLAGSSSNLIAREKAREAVESVHTARDTRVITFDRIKNVSQGGVFLNGATPLRRPGVDGLVNTADDVAAGLETMLSTGPDNKVGTSDDVEAPMTTYTREIQISELAVPNPMLRQVRVIITYRVGSTTRTYTLTTFVSSIS
jgi:prepilin-type N-terminal cleavage/methylation domain-containing protein